MCRINGHVVTSAPPGPKIGLIDHDSIILFANKSLLRIIAEVVTQLGIRDIFGVYCAV